MLYNKREKELKKKVYQNKKNQFSISGGGGGGGRNC